MPRASRFVGTAPWLLLFSSFASPALGIVLDGKWRDVDWDDVRDGAKREHWSAGFSRTCLDHVQTQHTDNKDNKRPEMKVEPAALPTSGQPVRLAMMMFVQNSIFNSEVWKAWFDTAKSDGIDYRFVVHAKEDANETMHKDFLRYVSTSRVWNDKCNLRKAMLTLIKPLLAEKNNITHFIVLSENSVPTKPLRTIYKELSKQPLSRFCADDNWLMPRAETWWMMRRADVEWFVEWATDIKKHFGRGCIDENMWYGAMKARSQQWPDKVPFLKECWMFADWSMNVAPCKDWARTAELCDCPTRRHQKHRNASSGHPVTWYAFNDTAFEELVRSPFWFARKFSDSAITLETAASILK